MGLHYFYENSSLSLVDCVPRKTGGGFYVEREEFAENT